MGTAIKHPVPDRLKPSFVVFDVRATQPWAPDCPHVKNYKRRLFNPVWHRMLYSYTHMTTVGVKGLNNLSSSDSLLQVLITYLALVLRSLCLVLRPSLETRRRVAVHVWFIEAVSKPLGTHFLALNVDSHPWVDVQYWSVRTERTTLRHQPNTAQQTSTMWVKKIPPKGSWHFSFLPRDALTPYDLSFPQNGGSICPQHTRMAISLQRVIRSTSCFVLGWGLRGRRI